MNSIPAAGPWTGRLLPSAAEVEATGLTPLGVVILAVSVTGILTLLVWCYVRVLRLPRVWHREEVDHEPR